MITGESNLFKVVGDHSTPPPSPVNSHHYLFVAFEMSFKLMGNVKDELADELQR